MAGPRHWPHLPYPELLPALCAGFEGAQLYGLADCRAGAERSAATSLGAWAVELVEWIADAGPSRIVGIGLDGDEEATGRSCPTFAPAYERARELGLGSHRARRGVCPAPRACATLSTCSASERIDHGVRADRGFRRWSRAWPASA